MIFGLASVERYGIPPRYESLSYRKINRTLQNGLCPFGHLNKIVRMYNSTATPTHQQLWFRPASCLWVALSGVVEYLELNQLRKQVEKIPSAAVISLPDFGLGNVVAALGYPGPDPLDMQIDAFETNVPNTNLDSRLCGLL